VLSYLCAYGYMECVTAPVDSRGRCHLGGNGSRGGEDLQLPARPDRRHHDCAKEIPCGPETTN